MLAVICLRQLRPGRAGCEAALQLAHQRGMPGAEPNYHRVLIRLERAHSTGPRGSAGAVLAGPHQPGGGPHVWIGLRFVCRVTTKMLFWFSKYGQLDGCTCSIS